MSIGYEILRQEAYERAMAKYEADQAREKRLEAARKRRVSPNQHGTRLGRGTRRISREEAVQILIAKGRRNAAARLLHSVTGGRTVR